MKRNAIHAAAAAEHVMNDMEIRAAIARKMAEEVLPYFTIHPEWTWKDAALWLKRNSKYGRI